MNTLGLTQQVNSQAKWPLHRVAQTQAIEHQAQAPLPAYTLVQRAGLATAQLALAIAPHAQKIWIACGTGNNGGDGLEAAMHLQNWDKQAVVTWLDHAHSCSADAQQASHRARAAGVIFSEHIPEKFDLAIDALLGIGTQRAPEGWMAECLDTIQTSTTPVLCVDIPTGLLADTGEWLGATPLYHSPTQRHTLSLLTLKPGLFTAQGRDAAGQVWFNDLGVSATPEPAAWLQQFSTSICERPHNSHKGSFDDVSILGGACGMSGAAVLAGLAALHAGAGRVLLGLMNESAYQAVAAAHPSLMVRSPHDLALQESTVVCGCGGSDAIHALLHHVLSSSKRLVLDADGLNAVARDTSLQNLLKKRSTRQKPTVLTPPPTRSSSSLELHGQRCTEKSFGNHTATGQHFSMRGRAQRLRQRHC